MSSHLTTSRAIAYYRMSTDRQEASIPEQREQAGRACAREGLRLAIEFQDDAISGSENEQRRGLMAMLAEAERASAADGNGYDVLVCWNADRFSRADSLKTAVVLSRLVDAGITRIYSITEGWVDLTNTTDRVLFHLKQDLGRHEFLKGLSQNVSRSMAARARQGLFLGSKPPYGLRVGPDGRLVFGPADEAETVRWIFRRYVEGASLAEIARDLALRGAPSPRGREWTRSSVRVILMNRAYAGDLVWNATHFGKHTRIGREGIKPDAALAAREARRKRKGHAHLDRTRNAPEDVIVVENAHPALIDRETFATAGRLRQKRRGSSSGRGKRQEVWVLSGLLHCGCCNRVMHAAPRVHRENGRTRLYRYYQCSGRRDKGALLCDVSGTVNHDWAVRETARLLKEQVGSPEAIEALRERMRQAAGQAAADVKAETGNLRRQIAELDGWVAQGNKNLAILPADRLPGVIEQLRSWEAQRRTLSERLANLDEGQRRGQEECADRIDLALDLLASLDDIINDADAAVAREALQSLVQKVTLHFRPATPEDRKGSKGPLRAVPVRLAVDVVPELLNLLVRVVPSPPPSPRRRR